MLQQLEEAAAGQGKEQAFGLLLFELKQNLQARVSMGYWRFTNSGTAFPAQIIETPII
jgi:hypothetical protein